MKKYISILAIIVTAGFSSCKKDFLSLEVNPNSPSVTTPQLTLAASLNLVPSIQENDYQIYNVWSGFLSWNGGVVPPASVFEYQFVNSDFSPAIWNDWYVDAANFNGLIATASKDPSLANFQAIAMIMKAYDFQELVDNFNDVPYTQAFQPSTILFPKYDKGSDIYTDLGKQLDAAVALIAKSGSAASPGNSDIVFGGDMTKWTQFANTLHLRLAIRESNLSANPLKTGLPASGSAYLSTDALSNPGYQSKVAGKQNPFYTFAGFDENGNPAGNVYRANDFAVKLLKNNNDPRLGQIFASATDPSNPNSTAPFYRGNIFGDIPGILGTKNTSGAGPALIVSPTQSAVLMLAAESYFLQSEAVERGYISGDAGALYNSGITASFLYLGLKTGDATAYIANNTYDNAANKVSAIITQKWIALCNGYDSFEQFNEYRRTGFPALPSSVDPAAISTHLPTRLYYPDTELDSNPDNYKAAGGLTINPFTSQIFWDTRTIK